MGSPLNNNVPEGRSVKTCSSCNITFVILVVVDVADENLVNIQGRYGILDQYSWVSSIPLKWPSIY